MIESNFGKYTNIAEMRLELEMDMPRAKHSRMPSQLS
jgi:hypothetical protein